MIQTEYRICQQSTARAGAGSSEYQEPKQEARDTGGAIQEAGVDIAVRGATRRI